MGSNSSKQFKYSESSSFLFSYILIKEYINNTNLDKTQLLDKVYLIMTYILSKNYEYENLIFIMSDFHISNSLKKKLDMLDFKSSDENYDNVIKCIKIEDILCNGNKILNKWYNEKIKKFIDNTLTKYNKYYADNLRKINNKYYVENKCNNGYYHFST